MGSKAVVVLDTNILVSALGWPGAERRVYSHCRVGDLQMVTSPPLLEELGRVLRYPKFRLGHEEISAFEHDVREHARLVHPQRHLEVIREDPDDDRVLECAVTGEAGWVITGDPHLLVLGTYPATSTLPRSVHPYLPQLRREVPGLSVATSLTPALRSRPCGRDRRSPGRAHAACIRSAG